jgi:HlyD family secretion protein
MTDLICSLPVLAALMGGCAPPPLATGYVEGEYVLLAPVETGRIDRLLKRRGDRVAKGEILVRMEASDAEIALRQAEAALEQARAQLDNLLEGKRVEEIAAIEATVQSALAQAAEAKRVFDRETQLAARGINAKADLDQASTALQQAEALVSQTRANLAVARLPARPKEIDAARAAVKQAQESLAVARWRLDQKDLSVPVNGVVEDVVRRQGEIAGPAQPVLSILPDGGVKIRLYLGESHIAQVSLGTEIGIRCDGCAQGLTATVTYIASGPEFTPPVIYSLENRQKLVYLIEARPDGDASVLKPGLIVDAVPGAKP